MYLLPAIDILGGKVVRLAKGDYDAVTVYGDDPAAQARAFAEAGAEWVHVVDLDGARDGRPQNLEAVQAILRTAGVKVELGGGVRALQTLGDLLEAGVSRVVLGTALVRDPDLAAAALSRHGGERLVAGIDARDGVAAVEGWREGSGVSALELARRMGEAGFRHLVYTDIARDGMRSGIDVDAYARAAEAFGSPVVVSGGISCADDIRRLSPVAADVEGVIAGRAVYEGTLTVVDGVAACKEATHVG